MENFLGYIVGAWFVASVWANGAAVVVWLVWVFGTLGRGR